MKGMLKMAAAVVTVMVPFEAQATCRSDAAEAVCAKLISAPEEMRSDVLQVGDSVPKNSSMLFNPEYYGLPPVSGYWRYYRVNGAVYEVHPETMGVLAVVSGGNDVLR